MLARLVATAGWMLVSGMALGQSFGTLGPVFGALKYHDLMPTKQVGGPSGTSGLGAKLPEKRVPSGPIPNQFPILIVHSASGETAGTEHNGIIHVEGGVTAEYKGYRMLGDQLDGNRHSDVYIVSGNAELIGPDAIVTASRILVDFRNRTYEAYDSEAQLRPSLVGGVLQTDLYANGEHSFGDSLEERLTNGYVTTCNFIEPHYRLFARDTDVRYERRIIFRDLDVYVLNHKLFHLPFLSLPLDQQFYNNLPIVGQDPIEGYYIKTRYGIPLRGDQTLYTRFDYMTRLGFGIGADYVFAKQTGSSPYASTLSAYGVTGSQTVDLQQSFDQRYKWGQVSLQNSYQGHDYLTSPDNTILNSQFNMSVNQRHGSTSFSFGRSSNVGPGFSSANENFGINNSISYGQFHATTQINYADSASSYSDGTTTTAVDRKEIDVNLRADADMKKADALLEYQRSIPVGQVENFFGTTDRTPNLTLSTDSQRLFGYEKGSVLPFQTSLQFGQFGDPQTHDEIVRDRFDFSVAKTSDYTKRSGIDFNSLFAQSFYSDDTAQYALGLNTNYHYRLGRDTSFNVRYNYLRPEGFTPLGIDQIGTTNILSEDVSVRPFRSLLAGLQSSYDFMQAHLGNEPWAPVGLRLEYQPKDYLLVREQTTYDPFLKGVADSRFDVTYKPGATLVGIGARYDNTRGKWAETDIFVNALKWARLTADIRASYNGYSDSFSTIQFSCVYDLHCAQAIFQVTDNQLGFQNGVSYSFFINIKGLPFNNGFGAGTRGQGFGYGTGAGY